MIQKVYICFRFVVFFFLFVSLPMIRPFAWTHAQEDAAAQSIEISPPSQEIPGDPGKTIRAKAKVTNKSGNSLPIKVRIEDFAAK